MLKLSICIPTYNRSQFLDTLLSSLYPATSTYKDDIEIVILDNCSSDKTESIYRKHRCSNIKYFRQQSNIGALANLDMCFHVAKGEFIWNIGDDDYILPGTIETIMPLLNEGYNGIILNFCKYRPDGLVVSEKHANIEKDLDIEFPQLLTKVDQSMIGFISANIFKRENYFSIPLSTRERLLNEGGCAHSLACYLATHNSRKVRLIAKPSVVQTVDNGYLNISSWETVTINYCNTLYPALEAFGYSRSSCRYLAKKRRRKEFIRRLLSDKYRNKPSWRQIRDIAQKHETTAFINLVLVPLQCIPNSLVRATYNLFNQSRV